MCTFGGGRVPYTYGQKAVTLFLRESLFVSTVCTVFGPAYIYIPWGVIQFHQKSDHCVPLLGDTLCLHSTGSHLFTSGVSPAAVCICQVPDRYIVSSCLLKVLIVGCTEQDALGSIKNFSA